MSWTDQRIEALRKFWQQGFSASQIAKKLGGVTRNAVIGKAHRLGLTGRSSSLKKQERSVTIESVPTYYQQIIDTTDKDTSGKPCMWPVGDPKQSDFHFCGEQAELGKPYCTKHCAVAYNRKSETAA